MESYDKPGIMKDWKQVWFFLFFELLYLYKGQPHFTYIALAKHNIPLTVSRGGVFGSNGD